MANRDIIIDDEFFTNISDCFVRQGERLDTLIEVYISELNLVREKAIISGDVADALSSYIEYVGRMTDRFRVISVSIKTQISNFLQDIDEADKYLF